jgi:hypothetical protein
LYYCLLLSNEIKNGNHEKIFRELKKIEINAQFRVELNELYSMHIYIRIPDNEINKLPRDDRGFYLPTSNMSGKSIEKNIYDNIIDNWINI